MLTQYQINAFKDTLDRRFQSVREEIRQALLRSDEDR